MKSKKDKITPFVYSEDGFIKGKKIEEDLAVNKNPESQRVKNILAKSPIGFLRELVLK